METTGCLSEDTLLEFLAGTLSPPEKSHAEEHLSSCEDCLRLYAMASEDRTGDGGATPPTAARAPEAMEDAQLISRYRVTGPIGAGGAGVVYSAWDPELSRPVAIKLLHAELGAQAEGRSRVLREAQAMARLKHPNVVAVYDVGTWREQVFIAMELVEGGTLREWQTSSSRSWREILQVYIAAGRGLAAAHAAGLVHRDFKPDNVLVASDGRVLVTDFGLARDARGAPELAAAGNMTAASPSPRSSATSPLTPIGSLVGTPAYMAPEQLDGAPATASSDLFAFCVSALRSAPSRAAVRGQDRVRPSRRRARGRGARGAARDASARPAAAPGAQRAARRSRVAAGLDGAPPRRSASGSAADPQEDPRRCALAAPRRERRRAAPAGSVGARGLLRGRGRDHRERVEPEPPRSDACAIRAERPALRERELRLGERDDRSIRPRLERDAHRLLRGDTGVRREQPAETFALRAACLDRRRSELGALTDLFLSADKQIVEHAVAAVSTLGDLDACANVTALAAPVPAPADPAIKARLEAALTKIDAAEARARAGVVTKETLALVTPALEEIRAIGHAPSMARAERVIGEDVDAQIGEHERGRQQCEAALYDATRGRDSLEVINALECLMQLVGYFLGRTDEGLRYSDLALAAVEASGNRETDIVNLKEGRSLVLAAAGRLDEALADRKAGLAKCEKEGGKESALCLLSRSNVGIILTSQGRLEEARSVFAEVTPALEKLLGVGHPLALIARGNLGSALLAVGRYDEAAPILEAAPQEQGSAFGERGIYFANTLVNLGELRLARGKFSEGLELQNRAIAIVEAISPRHPVLCEPLTQAGLALISLGRAAESLPLFERALAIAKDGSAPTDSRAHPVRARARAVRSAPGSRSCSGADPRWTRGLRRRGRALGRRERAPRRRARAGQRAGPLEFRALNSYRIASPSCAPVPNRAMAGAGRHANRSGREPRPARHARQRRPRRRAALVFHAGRSACCFRALRRRASE